jgi:hypothetical protein
MSLSLQRTKKSPLRGFASPENPVPFRRHKSKENIEVISEFREEPLKNVFVPCITPHLKSSIMKTAEKQDLLKKSSTFARIKAKPYQINYFDYYKIKKDFYLLSTEERDALLEDLYEFDKCFYLNQMNVRIHASDNECCINSQPQKVDWLPFWSVGQT